MNVLRASGAKFVEVSLPDFPYGSLADIVIGAEAGAIFEPLITSGKVSGLADPSQAASLRMDLEIPAKDYLRAMRIRTLLQQKFRELFTKVDLLAAPARYSIAPKITENLDGPDPPPGGHPKSNGMRDLISAGNLAGIPALTVPCGFANGMPLGLQFVGPAFSENMTLALGCYFQKQTHWHKRRPPLLS